MNPDEIYSESWVDEPKLLGQLPGGAGRSTADWYARERVYRNGRRVVEWYKRSAGGGPMGENGKPGDAMAATAEDVVPSIRDEFEAKQAREAERTPTTRVISGVLHERGADGIYRPVPTATGPATATARAPSATEQAEENERAWNEANGPGKPGTSPQDAGRGSGFRESHLERREREQREAKAVPTAGTKRAPVDANPGWTEVTTVNPATNVQETYYENPQGQRASLPGKSSAGRKSVPVATHPGYSVVTDTKTVNGKTEEDTYYVGPDGKRVAGLPEKPKDPTNTQIIEENGEKKEVIRNPDGSIKELRPLPGANSGGVGPRMPTIVADQSSETLTNIYNTLRDDPSLTPAQRERRLQEAIQIAQIAQTEANRYQAEIQSNRGAHVNVATARLTYMQAGMQQALGFVSQFIGKLPPGSGHLGATMFGALLGMQMDRAVQSGIYDLYPAGTKGPWTGVDGMATKPRVDPGPPRLTNPNDPAAVEKDLAESKQKVDAIFRPQPVTPPAGPPQAETVPGGQPVRPTAPQPAPQTPTAAPAPVTPAQPGAPVDPASIGAPQPPTGAPPFAAPAVAPPPAPQPSPVPGSGIPGNPDYQPGLPPGASILPDPNAQQPPPPTTSAPTEPGAVMPPDQTPAADPRVTVTDLSNGASFTTTRSFWDRQSDEYKRRHTMTPTVPTGELTMAPQQPPDYAALAAYTAPTPSPMAGGSPMPAPPPNLNFAALDAYQQQPQQAAQQPMQQTPLALLQAQAASKSPWEMSSEEAQMYLDAGVPEEVLLSIPGRRMA